ncbi:UNVERIFIED_CONTAM: hypothetical protein GTU68_050315 [Idotea baltica]|nr:hypothetical protein [Idotea baltica]
MMLAFLTSGVMAEKSKHLTLISWLKTEFGSANFTLIQCVSLLEPA